ncbi:MAG TPA: inositol monophosphatase family protein [candidate division Zixibacteria bacterium]|nr:inositol monophosphatase family protein [candidate division Zixibacteria bacterium]
MDQWQDDLRFAVEVANRAGELLKASYGRVERVDRKSKRDVVTEVDYASERLVLDAIREAYPADEILAEESGHHQRRGARGRRDRSRRTWVVDPLDGTVNYANAIPYFCVSIGLVEDGRPVVGVVLDPLRGDCFAAAADGPATLNGVPVTTSDKDELGDFVVSLAIIGRDGTGRERRIARRIRIPRRMGSAALSLAYVANGRFDAFVQNGGLSLWDVAAAGLIAERGGATVSDLYGGEWWDMRRKSSTVSVVAAPQPHHGELLELLASTGVRARTRR